ncbi:MAG: hypothetical protein U9N84_14025 [Actinomycetota bacterium]|nr:hypothetical protein [Actinomycetota bacterium]
MRRREILVFIAAFAVVLIGGAALAQVGTFASAPSSDAGGLSAAPSDEPAADVAEPVTDTTVLNATDRSDTTEPTDGIEPPGDDQPVDPPKDDEPPADPPKDEEPPADDDDTAPLLKILFPENEQHFDEAKIAFEGETEPGAAVTAGRYEADVDKEGNWRIVLILSPGGNLVSFRAEDAAGNVSEASVKVFLDGEEKPGTEFTARQKWEAVDGSPASNIYYGTARPGSKVWVGSKYGEGHTTANDDGAWELKVTFPEAPCNEHFGVVVEGEPDGRREFSMKYVCATHEFTANQKYGENTEPWSKFFGTDKPGATVWVASEYGTVETKVGDNGEWLVKLHFNDNLPANKEVGVVVESSTGGRAEFGFYWIVEEANAIDFTANQKYGSCGETVPYDVFFGTATPGATIWVESPYGGGVATAGDKGNWELRVEFPEAPVGESFTVVVESSDGGRATFSFVRTAGGDS